MWAGVVQAGSAVMGFLSSLVQWAGIFLALWLGGARQKAKANKKSVEIKDGMLELAARPQRHRDTLLGRWNKRLRRGGVD